MILHLCSILENCLDVTLSEWFLCLLSVFIITSIKDPGNSKWRWQHLSEEHAVKTLPDQPWNHNGSHSEATMTVHSLLWSHSKHWYFCCCQRHMKGFNRVKWGLQTENEWKKIIPQSLCWLNYLSNYNYSSLLLYILIS